MSFFQDNENYKDKMSVNCSVSVLIDKMSCDICRQKCINPRKNFLIQSVTEFGTRHNAKLKAYYERLKNIGKHTTAAQVAVMRKLLVIAHSLYKSGQKYKEE